MPIGNRVSHRIRLASWHRLALLAAAVMLAACATEEPAPTRTTMTPEQIRAMIVQAIPATTGDRPGWAADIHLVLNALKIPANMPNVCAVVATVEQESSFRANPPVPGLSAIAWREIDEKAERAGVPRLLVHAALKLGSPDGRSYSDRIDAATTEKELSDIFEDFIGMVPMGKRFFTGWNPVRTGGPMQVSIAWSEDHARKTPYPFAAPQGLRTEIFTRRGGLYFGIAHLLDYPATYDRPIYRFADFNAGHYASRNAAFQNALAIASGQPLELDGDLILPGGGSNRPVGNTEQAVRSLSASLGLDSGAIRAALEQEKTLQFERSALYQQVFAIAERRQGQKLPRAVLPNIQLKSPKITRKLTTAWFANRVDERHQRCLARITG